MHALKNMPTGKDHETHDIIHVATAIVGALFPVMIVWELAMVTWAFVDGKNFDLEAPYCGDRVPNHRFRIIRRQLGGPDLTEAHNGAGQHQYRVGIDRQEAERELRLLVAGITQGRDHAAGTIPASSQGGLSGKTCSHRRGRLKRQPH